MRESLTTGRRKAHSRQVARLALTITKRLAAQYAEYERDCDDDHARGYRAHYCEHGTSQWTDYDNICGPCESGHTDSTAPARRVNALREARNRLHDYDQTWQAYQYLKRHNIAIDAKEVGSRLAALLDGDAHF